MAGALLGEAFLSSSVQVLLDNIASREFRDLFRKPNHSLQINRLKTTLLALRAVLDDAEEKQITNHDVKEWLEELKDAVYDADDLLDEINADALKLKAEGECNNIGSQVWNCLSSYQFHGGMSSKIENLFQRLDHFAKQKDILGLKEGHGVKFSYRNDLGSVVDESNIYGRDNDKKRLMKLLLSDDENGGKLGVISILGLGGVGKTALAQLLYNEGKVKKHFDLTSWACVSEDFDVFAVTKTLLQSVTPKTCESTNLDSLRAELMQSLSNKKFLFVLDDLWNDKYIDWDHLITPFKSGKKGSKVIITTRHLTVAKVTQSILIHELKPLSHEDCWSLLAKHAFDNVNLGRYPRLESIGKKIAKKCGGLPLAAKALGGLLRSTLDEREWNNVLNSNIWDLPNNEIFPALQLSYHYLPSHLKRCFAYLSIFPKDYLFDRKALAQLWMAEGFILPFHSMKAPEEIADEYFDELSSRSLIERNSKRYFKMHDLINDLARVVSGKSCVRFEGQEIPEKVCYLSYSRGTYDTRNKFKTLCGVKHLRSFLALPLKENRRADKHYLTKMLLCDQLPKLKCLRVLSFSHYDNITELPSSVSNCIHLRYLNLSYTAIKRLPDTICTLYNLQTLLLSNCSSLNELPNEVGKLINLRHLDTSGTHLREMPLQIVRLQNLRTLGTFVVGKVHDGLRVSELRNFKHLQGTLSISNLQNVVDPLDALQANMKDKEQIEELELEWDSEINDSRLAREVLDHLRPPTNLKRLSIKSFGGTSFPSWLGCSSFSNMVSLNINDCNCYLLPPLGQLPTLEDLVITGMKYVRTVGSEFYGSLSSSLRPPFPKLRRLEFREMSEWKEWLPLEGVLSEFPSLRYLELSKCPKLKGHFPSNLPSILRLSLSDCPQLTKPVEFPLERMPSDSHWLLSLENLNINNCPNFQSLLETGLNSTCYLQGLFIFNFPTLKSISCDDLPTTLHTLSVGKCEKFELLSHDNSHTFSSLEWLHLFESYTSLKSLSLSRFPMLKKLSIKGCTNLESISFSESPTPFPQGGLLTPNLTILRVVNCKNLKSLPKQMGSLTALHELRISYLSSLVSFAEGGLPPNLRELFIFECQRLIPSASWGLQGLTCLREFTIGGPCCAEIFNTLVKEQLLPTGLLSLCIFDICDLKFVDWKQLQSLTSLEKLEIIGCSDLESLPEEGLPSSLSFLRIKNCSTLSKRCHIKTGEHCSKICHIPCVQIDEELII